MSVLGAAIRKAMDHWAGELERLGALVEDLAVRARRNLEEEINALPGERYYFTLTGKSIVRQGSTYFKQDGQPFVSTAADTEADLLYYEVPKDCFFIACYYPMAVWRITTSGVAADVGRWRPVYSWPLPDQVMNTELIDVSLRFADVGSERALENEATARNASTGAPVASVLRHVPSAHFSNPNTWKKLPVPSVFKPKSVIACQPKYDRVLFTSATAGRLRVDLPGYLIRN